MTACFLFIDYFIVQYGEPPFPFRVDSLQCKKHIMPERNIVIVFTILYGRIISAHTKTVKKQRVPLGRHSFR